MTIESIAKWFEVVYPETNPDTRRVQLGVHFEEVAEMLEAVGLFEMSAHEHLERLATRLKTGPNSLKGTVTDRDALLDALCDQIVTAIGVAHNFDLDIIGALAEVNRSNYSKFNDGVPIYDKNGKLAKGDSYEPPKLDEFIK
jgi:predicted HAD superfamily Cof-like phosphohydrolase